MYKAYNDYELLYMVKLQDTVALDILLRKYERYIYKKVYSFFYTDEDGDYFQEGILSLYRAIETFDDRYNKTFMRYFEVLIDRHFINLYNKQKRYLKAIETIKMELLIEEEQEEVLEPTLMYEFKSHAEQTIYDLYFVKNLKVSLISKKTGLSSKQVYNAIYRIKQKILEVYKK